MKETNIVLLSNKKEALPVWMKKYNWNLRIDFKVKNLFTNDLTFGEKMNGFTKVEIEKAAVIVSGPERAYLEYRLLTMKLKKLWKISSHFVQV